MGGQMRRISLPQQIEEVDRELNLRGDVYARQVASGRMRQSIADFHMDRLKAVRATLVWLERNEALIRERCGIVREAAPDGTAHA